MKKILLLTTALALLLAGCKPKVPRQYIQRGKMRRILYDYCIANEMAKRNSSDTLLMLTYKESIMRRHGVTAEEFDSSMVYYTRHTRLLHDIYDGIAKQLEEEAIAQGASLSDISKYGSITSASDTASVWPAERSLVLSPFPTADSRSFHWAADTSYHKGDKLVFDFDTRFISPEGQRNALALVFIKYAGDSVVAYNRNIISSTHHTITIVDGKRKGIEDVRCLFILSRPDNLKRSQLLAINNIKMVKLHTPEPEPQVPQAPTRTDSQKADTTRQPVTLSEKSRLADEPPLKKIPVGKP